MVPDVVFPANKDHQLPGLLIPIPNPGHCGSFSTRSGAPPTQTYTHRLRVREQCDRVYVDPPCEQNRIVSRTDHSPRSFLPSKKDFNDFNWAPKTCAHCGRAAGAEWEPAEQPAEQRSAAQYRPVNVRICRRSFIRSRAMLCRVRRRCGPTDQTPAAAAVAVCLSSCHHCYSDSFTTSYRPSSADYLKHSRHVYRTLYFHFVLCLLCR